MTERKARGLRFYEFGGPGVLKLETWPLTALAEDEALVAVRAAGLNPSDVKNVAGKMSQTTLPRVPGRDFSGVVVDGPAADIGAEVWGSGGELGFTRDGSHANFLVIPAAGLSRKPASLTFAQAAAVGVPFVTAFLMLRRAANVTAGETVLITGANGAVGDATAQVARWLGVRTIGAVRRSPKTPGTDEHIYTDDANWTDQVRELTGGAGVNVVIDTVGGDLFEAALRGLALDGRMIVITAGRNPRVSFNVADFYHHRLHLIGVDSLAVGVRESCKILDELAAGFEQGALKPPVITEYPLEDGVKGYEAVEKGAGQKIVLIPDKDE